MKRVIFAVLLLVFSAFVLSSCSAVKIPSGHLSAGIIAASFTNCLDCHKAPAESSIPKMPSNHSGYNNNSLCQTCHHLK